MASYKKPSPKFDSRLSGSLKPQPQAYHIQIVLGFTTGLKGLGVFSQVIGGFEVGIEM